jgi:hypothetical protein
LNFGQSTNFRYFSDIVVKKLQLNAHWEDKIMNIAEMEQILKEKGLLKAHINGSIKRYVTGDRVWKDNHWHNAIDVFGIYKGKDSRFRFFITDNERGIPERSAVYATENEVCDALLERISLAERIYQKNNCLSE